MEKTHIPHLDFILTKDELLVKSGERPESPQEFITKKRKLSSYSENSTNTKNESLNESFSNLTLSSNSNYLPNTEIKIPRPIRSTFFEKSRNADEKPQSVCDYNAFKRFAIEKNFNLSSSSQKENRKTLLRKGPLMYVPFGMPANVLDLLMKPEGNKSEGPRFVGPLSLEERNEKLSKYLEKKKNRKWKNIRYSIRKDLADQRERCQGRFVKSNRSAVPFGKKEGGERQESGRGTEKTETK